MLPLFLGHPAELFQLRLFPEESGKVEHERERPAGNHKSILLLSVIPRKPFVLALEFSAWLWENVN